MSRPHEMAAPDSEPDSDSAHGAVSRGRLQQLAIRGAYWTLVHTVISIPIAFLVNILLARVLGVEDYGRLAYLTAIMAIVDSVVSMGIGTGVVQFGSKAHAAGRTQEVKNLLSTSQAIHLVTTAPVLTIVVVSFIDLSPVLLWIAILFGVLLPSVVGSATYCFGIENKTAQGAQNALMVSLLTQVLVVVAIFLAGTADAVWAARIAMGGIGVALALFYVAPAYRRAVLVPRFRRLPPGFWKFSIPAGLASASGVMISSRIEVVVLTWMTQTTAAGTFALAFGLAMHLFSPAQALVGPLVPAVSGLHEIDRSAVGRALLRTLRASATVMALILAGVLAPLALLVPLIYGEDFDAVPPVLLVLGVSGGLMVIVSPLKAFVMARLSGMRLLASNLIALFVNLTLMVLLVPVLGVWGAVIGNASAAITQLVIMLVGESRSFDIPLGAAVRAVSPLALGALAAAAGWGTMAALALPPVAAAALAAVIGLVVFLAALQLTRSGLTESDRTAIIGAVPRAARWFARPLLRLCSASRA